LWQLQGAEQNMDLEPGPHLSSKRTASEESETLIPVSSVLSEEQQVRFSRLFASRVYVLADNSLGILGIMLFMSRSFGATDATIFLKVSVPGSLPYIVAGCVWLWGGRSCISWSPNSTGWQWVSVI